METVAANTQFPQLVFADGSPIGSSWLKRVATAMVWLRRLPSVLLKKQSLVTDSSFEFKNRAGTAARGDIQPQNMRNEAAIACANCLR